MGYNCHLLLFASVFFFGSFTMILTAWNTLFRGHRLRMLQLEVLLAVSPLTLILTLTLTLAL